MDTDDTMDLAALVELSRETLGGEWSDEHYQQSPALDPAELDGEIVIGTGYYCEYLADGNHRVIGMARWALEQGVDLDEELIEIPVTRLSREESERRAREQTTY